VPHTRDPASTARSIIPVARVTWFVISVIEADISSAAPATAWALSTASVATPAAPRAADGR
jgi:hypothetical protein